MREGALQAQPVADRFHVLKNCGEAVERFFQRRLPTSASCQPSVAVEPDAPVPQTIAASPSQAERYREIHAHRQRRESVSRIANGLALNRKTVWKYASAATYPSPTPSPPRA